MHDQHEETCLIAQEWVLGPGVPPHTGCSVVECEKGTVRILNWDRLCLIMRDFEPQFSLADDMVGYGASRDYCSLAEVRATLAEKLRLRVYERPFHQEAEETRV
jgi:hypothetical protein